ncbi:MAG: VTT domain-containing protein [Oscillospiraceae bacterium]|jgi:uncharacterized membrane protein YdjX (TVP38/TMEM64 family)|nr:VTT domain-containing protein [Oscillospiraceae bacterium]
MPNHRKLTRLLQVFRVLVALAMAVFAVLYFKRLRALDISVLTAGVNLALAVLIVLAVYLVKSVLFVVPAMLLYVSVGIAFPVREALLINLAGILLELCVTYGMGVFLGGDTVVRWLSGNKAGRKLLSFQRRRGAPVLFLTRLLPVFPLDFTGLYFGASRQPFALYLPLSLLGVFPRVALFTVLGVEARKLFPPQLLLGAVAVALPAAAVLTLLRKRRSPKSEKPEEWEEADSPEPDT